MPSARVPNEPHGAAPQRPDGPASADSVRLLRSITMTAAEDADEKSQLAVRVIDDEAPPVHTAAQPALGALEYSTSDMFGYFSHHELDWYHVVDSRGVQAER